jgi:hypothetical protein
MNIYKKAIENFGEKAQRLKAIEELGELIVAITQYGFGKCSLYDVASEIADVEKVDQFYKKLYEEMAGVLHSIPKMMKVAARHVWLNPEYFIENRFNAHDPVNQLSAATLDCYIFQIITEFFIDRDMEKEQRKEYYKEYGFKYATRSFIS